MITLIDSVGQEVDSAPYLQRLQVPSEKQAEIREWVFQAEEKVLDYSRKGPWEKEFFSSDVGEFLHRFTYAQNLLDISYQPAAATIKLIGSSIPSFRKNHSAGSVNINLYRVEKIARLGVPVQLSEEDKRVIAEVEDDYYGEDKSQLIKMLGRHAALGLPNIDPKRKKVLQEIVMNKSVFENWFGCSALRAGFALPSCSIEEMEYYFEGYIRQNQGVLNEIRLFGNRAFKVCQNIQKKEKDYIPFRLEIYVNGAHHLKRLLTE